MILKVLNGKFRGRVKTLRDFPAYIGSGEGCALRVRGPAMRHRHVAVEAEAGGYTIRELEREGKLTVKGRAVARAALAPGDTFALNGLAFQVDYASDPAVREESDPGASVDPSRFDYREDRDAGTERVSMSSLLVAGGAGEEPETELVDMDAMVGPPDAAAERSAPPAARAGDPEEALRTEEVDVASVLKSRPHRPQGYVVHIGIAGILLALAAIIVAQWKTAPVSERVLPLGSILVHENLIHKIPLSGSDPVVVGDERRNLPESSGGKVAVFELLAVNRDTATIVVQGVGAGNARCTIERASGARLHLDVRVGGRAREDVLQAEFLEDYRSSSVEACIGRSREILENAAQLSGAREVRPENLDLAVRRLVEARWLLDSVAPAVDEEHVADYHAVRREVQGKLESLRSELDASLRSYLDDFWTAVGRDDVACKKALDEILSRIEDRNDYRRIEAEVFREELFRDE